MKPPPSLPTLSALGTLQFDAQFLRDTPADPQAENMRRQVHAACYSSVCPTPVSNPSMLAWTEDLAESLGLPTQGDDPEIAQIFGGNGLAAGMSPYAACYGGHQFGNWAGQLGDGRAISLGELIAPGGDRWELQLKGAGPTPYSRSGDGRAVLRSSLREFVCSEAMHHLGVPTTRALSLVLTGDEVVRDMFYDGNAKPEMGAVVCRTARSFLRFGSLEIHAARGDLDTLRTLADHIIAAHAPHLDPGDPHVYAAWFREVCVATATMICHWMRVGFVHGVMNTDNMSVLGLTIDYGPYGWLDDYDPGWTPNTTDAGQRRYRFGAQPSIAAWNLGRLAAAIFPLIDSKEALEAGLEDYWRTLEAETFDAYAGKLGLPCFRHERLADEEARGDAASVINELGEILKLTATDMTIFFRSLADVPISADCDEVALLAPIRGAYYNPDELTGEVERRTLAWLRDLGRRVDREGLPGADRGAAMRRVNPKYVPRNYLAQLAIDDTEQGDSASLSTLIKALRRPYDDQPEHEHLAARRPDWAMDKPGCSMLSCSS
jgi:uncharacterized protein YdiU (UPF0061 family)